MRIVLRFLSLLVCGVLCATSPALADGSVFYSFDVGPTQKWAGGAPDGWPGDNPGPNHDKEQIIYIPKFYAPGATRTSTTFAYRIFGSASHDGTAITQIYTAGNFIPHESYPGGGYTGAAATGFAYQTSDPIQGGQVNRQGTGSAFFYRPQNLSVLDGSDVGQTQKAVINVAARLQPPNDKYYSSQASISSTWIVTHNYSGLPLGVIDQDQFVPSPQEKDYHRMKAAAAEFILESVDFSDTLSSIAGTELKVIAQLVEAAKGQIQDAFESGGKWQAIVGATITLITAALAIGVSNGTITLAATPGILALATASMLTTAYYTGVVALETKLANDPPDANYRELATYSGAGIGVDLGLGADGQAFFEKGASDITSALEARAGLLHSLERGQGALLANDLGAAWFQGQGVDQFGEDIPIFDAMVSSWFLSAPDFFARFEDANPGIDGSYTGFTRSAQFGAPPPTGGVPEPSQWLMLLAGFGFVGSVLRLKKKTQLRISKCRHEG